MLCSTCVLQDPVERDIAHWSKANCVGGSAFARSCTSVANPGTGHSKGNMSL